MKSCAVDRGCTPAPKDAHETSGVLSLVFCLRHFKLKQLAKVIFGSSRPEISKWRWEAMISPRSLWKLKSKFFIGGGGGVRMPLVPLTSYAPDHAKLLKSIRLAEVDNFFKQSFEQKKNWFHCSSFHKLTGLGSKTMWTMKVRKGPIGACNRSVSTLDHDHDVIATPFAGHECMNCNEGDFHHRFFFFSYPPFGLLLQRALWRSQIEKHFRKQNKKTGCHQRIPLLLYLLLNFHNFFETDQRSRAPQQVCWHQIFFQQSLF